MQYTVEIELALPRDKVIELFDDPANLVKWQRGLLSFDHLEGDVGQPGAKSKLVFLMGKRRIEMIETILVRDLPDRFDGTYDAKGVHNIVRNRFIEAGPNKTRWESDCEFEFAGFMKLIAFFMKSTFPKHSLKFMQDFKAFAEDGTDVRDTPG